MYRRKIKNTLNVHASYGISFPKQRLYKVLCVCFWFYGYDLSMHFVWRREKLDKWIENVHNGQMPIHIDLSIRMGTMSDQCFDVIFLLFTSLTHFHWFYCHFLIICESHSGMVCPTPKPISSIGFSIFHQSTEKVCLSKKKQNKQRTDASSMLPKMIKLDVVSKI